MRVDGLRARKARRQAHLSQHRCHPALHSSRASSRPFRLGYSIRCCAGRSSAHSSVIPGLLRDCSRPGFHRERTSHELRFPGSLPPRTAAHFAFVRSVDVDEQTTRPSRTVDYSGASPDFIASNPLSTRLLIDSRLSVHFQGCQALQALASSDSPHALPGIYTLLLSARQRAYGRDPGHPSIPVPNSSTDVASMSCWALQASSSRMSHSGLKLETLATAIPFRVEAFHRASAPCQGCASS